MKRTGTTIDKKLSADYDYGHYVGEKVQSKALPAKKKKSVKKADHAHEYVYNEELTRKKNSFAEAYACIHCDKVDYRYDLKKILGGER